VASSCLSLSLSRRPPSSTLFPYTTLFRSVVAGAPARVVRRWTPDDGWQPPLRTPAPVPIPEGVTPEQLRALSRLDERSVAALAELDETRGTPPGEPGGADTGPAGPADPDGADRPAQLELES